MLLHCCYIAVTLLLQVSPQLKAAALDALSALSKPAGAPVGGARVAQPNQPKLPVQQVWGGCISPQQPLQRPPVQPGQNGLMRFANQLVAQPAQRDMAAQARLLDEDSDFLAGLKLDFEVEQRHKTYPEAAAFLRFLHQAHPTFRLSTALATCCVQVIASAWLYHSGCRTPVLTFPNATLHPTTLSHLLSCSPPYDRHRHAVLGTPLTKRPRTLP